MPMGRIAIATLTMMRLLFVIMVGISFGLVVVMTTASRLIGNAWVIVMATIRCLVGSTTAVIVSAGMGNRGCGRLYSIFVSNCEIGTIAIELYQGGINPTLGTVGHRDL